MPAGYAARAGAGRAARPEDDAGESSPYPDPMAATPTPDRQPPLPADRSAPAPTESLRDQRPTERFSDRADDYRRYRPTYPEAAIDAVLAGLGDPLGLVVADVGAGTGISARQLAARGVRVLAVEPNAAMRASAEPDPRVTWVAGRAEATGLPDAGADLVVCAQSFHWFESSAALAEFRRILRPAGRLALMWNERDESDPATAEYSTQVARASNGHPATRRHSAPQPLLASSGFPRVQTLALRHEQALNADGLVGRAESASYAPKVGPARDCMVAALRAMHATYADADGHVTLVYRTDVYLGGRS